ncbi:MAG: hypothetical protein K0A98_16490 [Trueperaceae bacterium]|nr:hypothetical protein [Trueperaceae bacterium]
MTRFWHARPRHASVALAWLLAATLAFAGTGGGDGGSTPSDPTPTDPAPTATQYRIGLTNGSYADAYYDVYKCAKVSLGTYTDLRAMASTSSGSYKSSYLAHNVRLYANGNLVARSPDVERRVSGASETNYITSLTPVSVSHTVSCPQAVVTDVRARGWHKGISIHGHSHSLYTSDYFYG